jgi:tRNA(Ile)-lysidine synthase
MSLYSDMLKVIRRYRLLDGARTLVVGLSGGPDSVCLLDALALMVERGDVDIALHAAHLNHSLRGADSDADEQLAREMADARNVPITVERRDIGAAQAESGGSLEEVARSERYDFLAGVAQEVGAGAVAVGHNADDQAETVLHRIVRGAGLKGLRGIPLSRLIGDGSAVRVVRPLLRSTRKAIVAHLAERGVAFREDASNRDAAFTRNKIRHELLPLLKAEYNPSVGEALRRLARSADDAFELLLDVAHTAVVDCVSENRIDVAAFGLVHGAARPMVIDAAVEWVAPGGPQFDATHYEAIIGLALSGGPGSRLNLPGRVTVMHTGTDLLFEIDAERPAPPAIDVLLAVPGRTRVDEAGFAVAVEEVRRDAFDLTAFLAAKTRYDEVIDADAVAMPLVLRSRRDGDVFRPLGLSGGTKTVGDFLTDVKAPAEERERALVLTAAGEIVWLVGHRLDERAKVTDATERLLVLSLEPLAL